MRAHSYWREKALRRHREASIVALKIILKNYKNYLTQNVIGREKSMQKKAGFTEELHDNKAQLPNGSSR